MASGREKHSTRPPVPMPYQGSLPSRLPIQDHASHTKSLQSLMEPVKVMEKHGYLAEELTQADLALKRRCSQCHLTFAKLTKDLDKTVLFRLNHPTPPPPDKVYKPLPTIHVPTQDARGGVQYISKKCTMPCNFHPVKVNGQTKHYDCCGEHASAKPCTTTNAHYLSSYQSGELDRLYQFQFTPPLEPGQDRPIRAAVAIDCEMGTAISGDSELIRISAIDYYTGEVLINNLVEADQKLAHLNTKYSGVTWSEMNKALRQGTCLAGKAGARAALWRFVGPQTIIMGHAVSNDLRALRICHPCIVDSFLVEYKIVQAKKDIEKAETIAAAKEAEELKARMIELYGDSLEKDPEVIKAPVAPRKKTPKGTGDCALKTLMKKYLDTDVQMQGNKGHDSMEDAIAARDLIYWMVCNPEREV